MFHYYTLEEIYQFAESLGYTREDVVIEESSDDDEPDYYYVSFGYEYGNQWTWEFEDLTAPAVVYERYYEEDRED